MQHTLRFPHARRSLGREQALQLHPCATSSTPLSTTSRCAMCLCIRLGCNRCREKRLHLPELRQRQPLILAAPAQYPLEGLRSWRSRSSTCVILLAYAGRGLNLRGACCAHRPGSEKVAVSFGESSQLINPPQIAASPKLLQSALLSSGLRALFADAPMRCPALTENVCARPGPPYPAGCPVLGAPSLLALLISAQL